MQECEVGEKKTLQPSIDLFKNMQISICLLFFFKLLERLMRQIFFQSSDEEV